MENSTPKILKILITKIEVRNSDKGIVNFPPNFALRNRITKKGVCLFIEGITEKSNTVYFFTEQAIILKSRGYDNYEKLEVNFGSWFKLEHGEISDYKETKEKNKLMFIGRIDYSKVVPALEPGTIITISYTETEKMFEVVNLKNVTLIPEY